MQRIAESELIINNRGAVYHLDLRPDELGTTVLTVGDPDRVSEVSKYFDSIEHKSQHREFITHTGFIGNKRLSVVSTGIGPDNIDIVLNELDALVNIDFDTRTIKNTLTTLQIIRLGTSGSLQANIPVDSFVASTHGLGIDNLLHFYKHENNGEEAQILKAFEDQITLNKSFSGPYITGASVKLLLPLMHTELIDQLTTFNFGPHKITNFEMETSAIYGLGKLQGHQCLSLSAIVANRVSQTFSKDGNAAVENLIKQSLDIISTL
jgi:uridine phosphorylase